MELLHALQNIRTPFLDGFFLLITRLGEEIVVMTILCVLYWCVNKKLAYGIGIAYFFSGLAVQGLKMGFQVQRPWVRDPGLNPVAKARGSATGFSFPSGHSQSAGAVGGALAFRKRGRFWQNAGWMAPAVLVGFSRLYLGVHTLLDVVVGLGLSLAIAFIVMRFVALDEFRPKRDLWLSIVIAALSLAVLGIALASAPLEEAGDGIKAAGAGVGFAVGLYVERRYIQFSTAAKNFWYQLLKLAGGLAGLLAIKEGIGALFTKIADACAPGIGQALDAVCYFLVIFWAIALYPLIIKKFFEKPAVL